MKFHDIKNKYAIVGVGYTQQGKVEGITAVGFHAMACANALKDAKMDKKEIDALLLYRHFDPVGTDADITAFTLAEQLGIKPNVVSQEYYCTRDWLVHAIGLMEIGLCSSVMVSYGDNAKSGKRAFTKEVANNTGTDDLAAYGDLSTLSKYAMLAKRASHVFGTGEEIWKEIAISQRRWANLNPNAVMHSKVMTDEDYYNSAMVVDPLRLFDATPTTDGGRAVIITSSERAKAMGSDYVLITGLGIANDPLSPYRLKVEEKENAAYRSSKMAYGMAKMTTKDIDALELYDCFTYTVEATLRAYGFCEAGKERDFIQRDNISPGGKMPVNTSGGMLSEAYFMGLTPFAEAVMQLRGKCGDRQLGKITNTKEPEVIMCSDNGGVFQSHCTTILTRG